MNKEVTIIVPVYNNWEQLKYCLDSLRNQSFTEFVVIVVNNNPTNNCPYENEFKKNENLINEEKKGSYAARNAGINLATSNIIGFIDSDCIAHKNWIKNAVEAFNSNTDVDRVTGPINIYKEPEGGQIAYIFESVVAFNQLYNTSRGLSVTANLFVKSTIFNKVGMFDERYFSGGDSEWNKRAADAGYLIKYDQSVIVKHPARRSIKEIRNKFYRKYGARFLKTSSTRELKFIFKLAIPPFNAFLTWVKYDKGLFKSLLSLFILWYIKSLSIIEIVKIKFGNEPRRE